MSSLIQETVADSLRISNLSFRHLFYVCGAYFVCRAVYWLIVYPRFFSPLRHLPGPPVGEPILGQARKIFSTQVGMAAREWINDYGSIVRAVGPVGLERLIFITPEGLHQIMSRPLDCPRPLYLRNFFELITGRGLLTVMGDEHKQMRRVMNPAFSLQNLMAQTDMYYEPITNLVNIISTKLDINGGKGVVLPMYEWLSKVTLDIICETAFGYHADSLNNPHDELAEAYERLLNLQTGQNMFRFVFAMTLPGGPRFLSSDFAYRYRAFFEYTRFFAPFTELLDSMHRIRKISRQILSEKVKDLEESGISANDMHAKKDIMSLLMRARASETGQRGYAMNDNIMVDQVLTFLGAGHETTASGLTWTLWLLANNKEYQSRLREEVTPVFQENPRPDYRTLNGLEWLDCVVMESLRVMPPIPTTVRKTATTDYIDGVLVPEGTLLQICIRQINTWKQVWGEDAEEFRPERWFNLPKAYNPSYSHLSFISGPHSCIGKTMAIIEMKAVLASLILNFDFDPAYPGQEAKPASAITMKPTDRMPLTVRRA
ncbi:cytochrome P450 [Desarmillaria tabescens]|uniref:Cytochrome P450 n=1 Tax=Armillaria tabescens TaxID=1929756 RepID=A0AA39NK19_ARMTA|nr:cytochrome P450 [Desarmillaria tabescens]KAK0467030.1 cytochrome P450 [Desarmillaria tabescens]